MGSFLAQDRIAITISSGSQESNAIPGKYIGDAVQVMLFGPAALDGGHTYIIQVSGDYDESSPTSATWQTWQQGDTSPGDAAPPLAGKARTYFDLAGCGAFRIRDITGAVAADRTWLMNRVTNIE